MEKNATPVTKSQKKRNTKQNQRKKKSLESRSLHDLGDHILLNLGRRALARLRLGEKGEEYKVNERRGMGIPTARHWL
jgi:hypothetical protein